MSEPSLTLPLLRPARVARLLCMMQKKRAFGPLGSLVDPLCGSTLLAGEGLIAIAASAKVCEALALSRG